MASGPIQFSSAQFSCSVVSDFLRPHEFQYARPSCPSPTPGVHSNSCPSSQWCHPAISSSVVPFSSCPPSLPASGSFPMSQLFTSSNLAMNNKTYFILLAYRLTISSHKNKSSMRVTCFIFFIHYKISRAYNCIWYV